LRPEKSFRVTRGPEEQIVAGVWNRIRQRARVMGQKPKHGNFRYEKIANEHLN
jgi:hypothetical protein